MGERKKSVFHLLAAAVLLFAVSAYRQLSIRYWPEDFLRPYLVWAVYMLQMCIRDSSESGFKTERSRFRSDGSSATTAARTATLY